VASLLIGKVSSNSRALPSLGVIETNNKKYSEIDASDGSGMNLMDIKAKSWLNDALKVCIQ